MADRNWCRAACSGAGRQGAGPPPGAGQQHALHLEDEWDP